MLKIAKEKTCYGMFEGDKEDGATALRQAKQIAVATFLKAALDDFPTRWSK